MCEHAWAAVVHARLYGLHRVLSAKYATCTDDDAAAAPAGVLSSYGELQHMASGKAELAPFDPTQKQPKMSYKARGSPPASQSPALLIVFDIGYIGGPCTDEAWVTCRMGTRRSTSC
jgi:hypothetical protein